MKRFRVACAQMASKPNDVEYNVEKGLIFLERAVKEHGAQVVVFPESVTTGFDPAMPAEEFARLCEPIPGSITRRVGKAARELGVYVLWPMYEKPVSSKGVYNSACLIGPDGEVLGTYRKTHPFPTERIDGGGWTIPGRDPVVIDTPLAAFGIMICYDGDFPELARVLAIKGAEVILRPSAFLRSFEIWELTNRARAYDNHVYVVATNAIGPDAAGNYYAGHSMIVDPTARKLAQARGTEEIISFELDPDPLKTITYGSLVPMVFHHLRDRNLDVYREILQEGKSPFEPKPVEG